MPSKRRQTIVWSILSVIAIPALSVATTLGMNGEYVPAVVAGAVGFVALVAFAASVALEHPVEDDLQETLNEVSDSKDAIRELSTQMGDLVVALDNSNQSGTDGDSDRQEG